MKNAWILLILSSFFISCQKDTNLEVPEQAPRLGVEAIWNKNNALEVTVTRTFSIKETPQFNNTDNYPSILNKLKTYAVANAKVLVFKDGNVFDELFYDNERYLYKSNTGKTALPDGSYSIKTLAPGFKEVMSPVLSFPETIAIKSIEVKKDVGSNGNTNGIFQLDEIILEFDDPVNTKNFYWINIKRNFLLPSPGSEYITYDAFPIDTDIIMPSDFEVSNNMPSIPYDRMLLTDNTFNGSTKRVRIRVPSYLLVPSPSVVRDLTISLNNVSEDLFKYIKSRVLDSDNPFSTPIQAYTNMTNGLGILGLYGGDTRVVQ